MIVLSRDHLRQSIITKTLGVNAVLEVMPNVLNKVKVERNLLITKKETIVVLSEPCQSVRKCLENSMENMHTDIRV